MKQYKINNSLILYVENISVAYHNKIVVSEFILSIANGDTLYDIGLVKYKNEKIGHFGRCDHSTRFLFSDTTFQEPVGDEYCLSLYTSNDYGKGIVFNRGRVKNGKTYITLFAKKNVYKICFIDLAFDSEWILNNLSFIGSELSNYWR